MSHSLAKILCIEDAKADQNFIRKHLGRDYELAFAASGDEGIARVSGFNPDLVLLDVNMPDINGLEVCRHIRELPETEDLPIVFISGMSSAEDRLAGYRAGGDEYLGKPFDEKELVSKVTLLIKAKQEKQRLKEVSQKASQAAIAAVTRAAELGFIVTLLRESFACEGIDELGEKVFNTLTCYALDGSLLLRFNGKDLFYPKNRPLSEKEKSALIKAHDAGRIFQYQDIAIFSTPKVSLLIRQMPSNSAKVSRLLEHLAILVEGVEARLKGLEIKHHTDVDKQLLEQSVELTHGCLEDLKEGHYQQRVATAKILSDVVEDMEELFLRLGLDETQEQALLSLILEAERKTEAVFFKNNQLQEQFEEIKGHLNSLI
ncbi:PleD family two-component system response regulator [Aliikangiella sp. G2MR2-5]|uniref:response regulator n=1 Tax=Aliikangiella sp. G2MR2-5 TaxID=2788943 RepID=UPI0018A9A440|nr:response regulator [Aliikangiella sp. G2MR2-5]